MTVTNIENIALSKLVPSAENVRRTNSQVGISELADSIEAHGLIQNLTVRKGSRGKFEVVAGSRRLAALRLLAKEGRLENDAKIACNVLNEQSDTEISLAENMQRERMHPVDEIEAFRKLNDDGLTPEAIGDRFGMSHMTVRRRLKLAHLSPRILEVMRTDEITMQQAEALALSDDHEAQNSAWFGSEYSWQRQPHALREALSKEQVRGDHKLARFVTLAAYKDAGGNVVTDLFSDDDESFLSDRVLLVRLATEKLASLAEQCKAEGWLWAEPDLEGNAHIRADFERIHSRHNQPSEEISQENDRLSKEYDELAELLNAEAGTEDELSKAAERVDAIEARQEEIRASLHTYDPQEVALAGCLVSLDYNGEPRITKGWVRRDDWATILELRGEEGISADNTEAKQQKHEESSDTGTLSAALVEELTAIRTAALRVEMTRQPTVALAALLQPLLVRAFYPNYYGSPSISSAVEVRGEYKALDGAIQNPSSHRAYVEWAQHLETVKIGLPHEPGLLWDWLLEQETPVLLNLLATVSAANTNAIRYRHDIRKDGRIIQSDEIARAMDFNMSVWWTPNVDFLDRISKKAMGHIMRDQGIAEDRITAMQKLPKHEAVHRAEAEIMGLAYMPECLTTPELDDEDVPEAVQPTDDSFAIAAE
ncbi:ParB family chromosome partitioning protein [Rhizobium skierniewicense]|uniref:ParB family chromosome partitioning protein n=1 Tax=Rhizobium skierniewicense TaxID=984260 RepID=A0A7W6CBJ5_9HYPH|nr:ParB/RepB/Spo0J family partition protein [Rhizobium skierniewicense]MBB3948431.1 ParB family chromosome partitioning protein [Rhizobium skierniewicense]